MKKVVVSSFGGPEVLELREGPTPEPGSWQVLVRLTSIGMNHAELMMRRGDYQMASGEPPFTPGLEGGGVIEAVGDSVTNRDIGQRVILGVDLLRRTGKHLEGSYRTHVVCDAAQAVPAPDAVPDEQLGALWLPYLTAWGCLVWKHDLQPGAFVALPAASSSVALAAAQIVRELGGHAIGMTTSAHKVAAVKALPGCAYEQIIVTTDRAWHQDLKDITDGHGVDVFFDPVAAGEYLNTEIRCLAQGGTVWIYGLLGEPDVVQVTPLIMKSGAIRGWALAELAAAGAAEFEPGYRHILDRFADGTYVQHIGGIFPLDDVRRAHAEMEKGDHIGKLVLIP